MGCAGRMRTEAGPLSFQTIDWHCCLLSRGAGSTNHVSECLDRSAYPVQQTRQYNMDCSGQWSVQLTGQWSACKLISRPTVETTPSDVRDDAVQDNMPQPAGLAVDGVGMLSAARWNCGIGRRYHSVVCHNVGTGQNVSAAECNAKGIGS